MTISTSFQASSVTALQLSITSPPAPATATPSPAVPQDRVTLSSGATAPLAFGAPEAITDASDESLAPTGLTTGPVAPTGKGAALFSFLDADKDGQITKREFTEAASSLLRRDAPPRANDDGRGRRGLPGLERRLAKAFDRIDGDGDGSLSATELATARAGRRRGTEDDEEAAPTVAPGMTVTVSYVRITSVSIAVQRYDALQAAAPSTPLAAPVVTAGAREGEADSAAQAPAA